MKRLREAVIVPLAALFLLAGCGGGSEEEAASPGSDDAAATTTSVAARAKSALTCADIPASEVNQALGTSVPNAVQSDTPNGYYRCQYNGSELIITLANNADTTAFNTQKQALPIETSVVNDLGDEAFSGTAPVGAGRNLNFVAARQGSRMVLLTSIAPVDKSVAFVRQILNK